jgi:hypothetical protein
MRGVCARRKGAGRARSYAVAVIGALLTSFWRDGVSFRVAPRPDGDFKSAEQKVFVLRRARGCVCFVSSSLRKYTST